MFFSINKRRRCPVQYTTTTTTLFLYTFCVWDRSQKRAFTSKGRSALRSTTRPLARLTVCHCLFLSVVYTRPDTQPSSKERREKNFGCTRTTPFRRRRCPPPYSGPTRSTDLFTITGYTTLYILWSGTCGTATSSENWILIYHNHHF